MKGRGEGYQNEKSRKAFEPLFGKAYASQPFIADLERRMLPYPGQRSWRSRSGCNRLFGQQRTSLEDEYAYDIMLRLARNLI